MSPMLKECLLCSFYFLWSLNIFCQGDAIMVKGVVVEVTNGKKVPVPNVKVKVPGESEDITKMDGSFTLYFPPDKEYISISLEGCPYPIVSPYAERINIPPDEFLEIKVCANENKKLRGKINALNNKIKSLERQRVLNKRQLAAMHQTLLDTILHYESRIVDLEKDLQKSGEDLEVKSKQIIFLENEIENLETKLTIALEEKYLRQKEVFDKIAAALTQYIDQAKNLRDEMRPVQVKSYFSNPGARERLYKTIERYNAARQEILDNHQSHIVGVANYWEKFELADELEEVYNYLLKNVHDEGIYPMEFSVNDNLKQALTRQISSTKAKKAAEDGAEEAILKLNPMIVVLEEKATDIIFKLKNNL